MGRFRLNKLEEMGLPQENGIYLFDGVRWQYNPSTGLILKSADGEKSTHYYHKMSSNENILFDMGISKMFGELGYATPEVNILCKPSELGEFSDNYSITQDVNSSNEDYEYFVGYSTPELRNSIAYLRTNKKDRWSILYDENVRQTFLEYMTDDCFDDLVAMFMVDEPFTMVDRNFGNFIFARRKGCRKFSEIIPIDHELAQILIDLPNTPNDFGLALTSQSSASDFRRFIDEKYMAETPLDSHDELSLSARTKKLKDLINSGLVPRSAIRTLKRAIEYDLAGDIERTSEKIPILKVSADKILDPLKYLHEYNMNQYRDELSL